MLASKLCWLSLSRLMSWCVRKLLCPQAKNKYFTNQRAYNPLKLLLHVPFLGHHTATTKTFASDKSVSHFSYRLRQKKRRAKERKKEQSCKIKRHFLCLNSSACGTNTRLLQKLCLSTNRTSLFHSNDLSYTANKHTGTHFGRWYPAAEICISAIGTQHLAHIQPGSLKEIIKFQPRFQTYWASRAPSPCIWCWRGPCIQSLLQGDLQQTSHTAQINGYFSKSGYKTLIAGRCPHDCWSSAELNPWTSQKLP